MMMKILTNWKTTALGVAGIFAAGSTLLTALTGGDWNTVMKEGSVICVGIAAIFAKDA